MNDFLLFKFPFRKDVVLVMGDCGFLDFEALAKKTGLKISAGSIEFAVNAGKGSDVHDLYCPYQTIPSSFTEIACKAFDSDPRANTYWPYLELKASPAKVMQGHNVYGSESLRLGVEYMLDALATSQPELFDLLDVGLGEIVRIDCTYSISMKSKDVLRQTLKALGNISNRSIRPARNVDYDSSVYFNKASKNSPDTGRTKELVIYSKSDEVEAQARELERKKRKDNTSRYDKVLDALNNPELRQFASCRLRFEGRAKKRFIMREVGSCNIWKVIRHAEQFEQINGYPFCEYLFKSLFKDLFDAVSGEELEIYNDDKIKQLLRLTYQTTTPKGNISYATADRIYGFYTRLCDRGWSEVKGAMNKASFYRNVKELQAIGLSRADLQQLSEGERMPLSQILTFDFDKQRPADYVEPVSPFADSKDPSYLGVAFGVTPRLSHEVGLSNDPVTLLMERLGVGEDFDIEPFIEGVEVPVTPRESLSLVIWPDGEMTLTLHKQRQFKPNKITALLNPEPEKGYLSIIDSQ
ncbi:phage/plasmid replication protein, II/X family [Vibrio scophthalmi]|uniref:Replication-associated protein G2P n=1 Tax=Vibrio scophthalmi TaxID=45658 RepID=A0A1E3WFY9_9VIBR|nr:phage/plasmid replication protein, II/X family [Vibrio scophthalmi]ODS04725.1 Replication-associated protein G2P [Vibrio scophthalmi]ODS04733.1 Replication-associated protein G2P [Vibrio scophthalmi]